MFRAVLVTHIIYAATVAHAPHAASVVYTATVAHAAASVAHLHVPQPSHARVATAARTRRNCRIASTSVREPHVHVRKHH